MPAITLKGINKIYGENTHVVHDLSLDIDEGEFVVLVGPSGCGKSTILRMIAGLEDISFGSLFFDGKCMNGVSAKDRNVAMVFQNYALFPHLTVKENIAFRLKLLHVKREEIEARVKEAAEILGLENLLSRKPAQLSGGQKQRVALGRAIVSRPSVFLLDEPLSNLDAKLRSTMRSELVRLHRKLGISFIYVTHDQTEALTMGTRIAVLRDGYLQQYAEPLQLYEHPANKFVAGFLGSPQISFFNARLVREGKNLYAAVGETMLAVPEEIEERLEGQEGRPVILGLRPEHLSLSDKGLPAVVDSLEPYGYANILHLTAEGAEEGVRLLIGARETFPQGEGVSLAADMHYALFFDAETGISLLDPPPRVRLHAQLIEEDGSLYVRVGDAVLPLASADRLTDDAELSEGCMLSLPPSPSTDGEISLPVRVLSVYPRISDDLIRVGVAGTEERLIFSVPKGKYRAGEETSLFFTAEEATAEDASGERILTKHPSRGRWYNLDAKGKRLRILANECLGNDHVLYLGTEEDYVVVRVPLDYPLYESEFARVEKRNGPETEDSEK